MCHPPLVCPLCSSAGGFPSPGALWLGLIGVANRLLSCPVCHELLLGLDKLTIHLVSHVPDLNLLASTIGNYVNSNQKAVHEFEVGDASGKRFQNPHFTFNEDVLQKNHYFTSSVNCKSLESDQNIRRLPYNSDSSSNISQVTGKLDDNEKEPASIKTYFCNSQAHYSPSLPTDQSKKNSIYYHTGTKDTYTQTVKDLGIKESIEKNKGEHILRTVKYTTTSAEADDNILINQSSNISKPNAKVSTGLIDKDDNPVIQSKYNFSHSAIPNESFHKSLKRSNTVLAPVEPYYIEGTKNILQHERLPSKEKLNERTKSKVQDKTLSSENEMKFKCGACSLTLNDQRSLSFHNIMVHSTSDMLESSIFQKVSSKPTINFPCELCSRKLVSKGALLVHMRFAHSVVLGSSTVDFNKQKDGLKVKSSRCDVNNLADSVNSQGETLAKCVEESKTMSNFNIKHHNEIHYFERKEDISQSIMTKNMKIDTSTDERQINSEDSSEIIDNDNSQDLQKEESSNGSPPQHGSVDEEMKHSCKICDAQFGSVIELISHRPAHTEDDNCICVVCGKTFKKEQHLQQHLRTHEGKQWECDICSKFFTTKYFLKKHKRLHTGEMPYSCETCGKTFTFQQSYHKHLLYHSDEKPHACGECGKRFKELSTLHNHERIHTGEKPFTCESCGKAFRQRVSYLVHRRIHTGVMPYKCTACEKSFRYKVSQRTHKCSSQQTGTVVRQSSDLVERLLSHQKVKSSISEGSSAGEVFFSIAAAESLTNPSQTTSQQSNETLQEFPKHSTSKTALSDQKVNYSSTPNTLQVYSNMSIIEPPKAINPFSVSKSVIVNEQKTPQKTTSNSQITLSYNLSETQDNSPDSCSVMSHNTNQCKTSETSLPHNLGKTSNEQELSPEQSSDPNRLKINLPSEIIQKPDLDNKEEEKSKDNTEEGVIFDQTLFSSTSHLLDSTETDFFTMVMSPAEPALEQMGKLTISSIPSPPEKPSLEFTNKDNKQFGETEEERNSQAKSIISCQNDVQNTLLYFSKDSKNVTLVDNPPTHKVHESTANAADLSSFLQSCFDQWNSSNYISNEKSKEDLVRQNHQQLTIKPVQCISNVEEDNRLHTINEESLKKLLYGDSVS